MNRGKGRSFVGFLLTYFLVVTLICTSLFVCLRVSFLKGDDVKSFIKSLDLGEAVQEIVSKTVKESGDKKPDAENKISDELVDSLLTEDVVSDVTDIMVEAITDEKEVDLSQVKDSCMNAVIDMSEQTVDDVIEELKANGSVIDAESLKNNSIISQYQKDFNIDVTTPILEQMQTVYGSKSVNIEDIDVEEVKSEAKEAVKTNVIPKIEVKVDKLIKDTNIEVNEQMETFRKDTDIKGIIDVVDLLLAQLMKSIIIGIVVSIIFIVLQFVVYKKDINKAFKNIGVSGAVLGVLMLLISKLVDIIRKFILSSLEGEDASVDVIRNIVNKYVPKMENATSNIGLISIIITVLLIVVAVILKKKLEDKDALFATEDTFADGTSLRDDSSNLL
ncbi:MAG: hypothetical protein IJD58_03960 [Lachnospiraceae bacterium]|nr:hypothetical protein [Lachnospiraceae bacterium]